MKQRRQTMIKAYGLLLACAFVLLWTGSVRASIVLYLSDLQMSQRADRIVRARVTRKVSRWDPKKKRIYTYITLSVLEPIKGASGSQEIQIRQLGGTANGIGMYIPGAARFQLGEEVLVFLEKIKNSPFHRVMSMSYGKFQVVTDPKTKVRTLVRQVKGLSLARRGADGKMVFNHPVQPKQPLLLSTYVQKLRSYLKLAKPPTIAHPVPIRPILPKLRSQKMVPKRPLPKPGQR